MFALSQNTIGNNNTTIGANSASGLITGSANTILGANVNISNPALSNNIIIADGDGNQRINVTASGNVGIGTNTPLAKLDIAGNIKITD
jgi:hypothetical protein